MAEEGAKKYAYYKQLLSEEVISDIIHRLMFYVLATGASDSTINYIKLLDSLHSYPDNNPSDQTVEQGFANSVRSSVVREVINILREECHVAEEQVVRLSENLLWLVEFLGVTISSTDISKLKLCEYYRQKFRVLIAILSKMDGSIKQKPLLLNHNQRVTYRTIMSINMDLRDNTSNANRDSTTGAIVPSLGFLARTSTTSYASIAASNISPASTSDGRISSWTPTAGPSFQTYTDTSRTGRMSSSTLTAGTSIQTSRTGHHVPVSKDYDEWYVRTEEPCDLPLCLHAFPLIRLRPSH